MSELDQPAYLPAEGEVQRIAVDATGDVTEQLLARLQENGWLRLLASGADVDVLFGDEDVDAPAAQNGTSDVLGYTVKNGTYHDFYRTNQTHVGWIASGTGTLTISWAGRRRVKTESV